LRIALKAIFPPYMHLHQSKVRSALWRLNVKNPQRIAPTRRTHLLHIWIVSHMLLLPMQSPSPQSAKEAAAPRRMPK
jgi:hypothetical protein